MRKLERILIALVVFAVCVWFLFPTIKWYGFVSAEDKALTTGSSLQVKEYSQGRASEVLQYMEENPDSKIPEEYSFVIELAKAQLKIEGKGGTDVKVCSDVLEAFSTSKDEGAILLQAVEQYCREYIQNLKELSSKALQPSTTYNPSSPSTTG